ncbi:MAG TPA: response regulator [Planctomycetota bacterium]|nr:response regulator [Planctomycetota bacterium]
MASLTDQARILAIDDAPLVLETYKLLFEGRVETASTVAEGLGKLRRDESLRIVLADLNMKDGGIPLLQTLHRKFPDRLVIVLSGDASAIDERRQRELGIFRCLEKGDASYDLLEDTIREATERLKFQRG